MARLATAYSHFRPYEPSIDKQAQLRELANRIAHRYSSDFFKTAVDIEVYCEEGSWKTWVTAAGVLYGVVAGYGSFREGIEWIVKDARSFSQFVNQELISAGNIPNNSIYRTERRTETPGRILRTLDEAARNELVILPVAIGTEEQQRNHKIPQQARVAIRAAERQRRRVINILRDLNSAERDAFFAALPKTQIPSRLEDDLRIEADASERFDRILDTDGDGTPTVVIGIDGKLRRLPK